MKKLLFTFLALLTLLHAKEHKLELGFGVGTLYYPNYIGSKTMQTIIVPLPFVRYRSKYIRIDEDGLSGKLFGIDGLRVDLSMSGTLPAESKNDDAREGMPDLELTGEVGLQLVYKFFEYKPAVLEFELPLRAALSTDFTQISYRGLVSNPQLKFSLNFSEFEWTFRTGLVFGDSNYHNYYYGVKQEYVTPSRALYDAKGGLNAFRSRIGMTYRRENWWAGAFISYYNLNSSVFKDSPLVETESTLYMGASLAYIFHTVD